MFVTGKWHLLFLMERICRINRRFAYLEGSIIYASQRREEALNECSYVCFWTLASVSDWFQIADFWMIRTSGFSHFRFMCQPAADWMEGLLEVVENKTKLIFWFSSKLSSLDSCFTDLFSSKHDTVSSFLSFGLSAWNSNRGAYQPFFKYIYWNFIESGISGTVI